MPEYITKEQVIELLHYNTDEACSAIVADVEQLPAADVVKVVRCKNCKHYTPFDNLDYGTCTRWYNEKVEENYFCGKGKRKEGESND